jgi:hypothetical protein
MSFFCCRERDADPGQRGDALDRVVQRLAQLDRGRLGLLAHRGAHVRHDRVVWLKMSLPLPASFDVLERQQQVGAGLDRLVVDAGLVEIARQVADLLRGDLGGAAVVLMTWAVIAPTFCASRASAIER